MKKGSFTNGAIRMHNDTINRGELLDSLPSWLSDFDGLWFLMSDMNLTDNVKLLRDYAEHGDEAAFRDLVERYVDLVYSTAVRNVGGDSGLAQDVTQKVFCDMAFKAKTLSNVAFLGGWLHRHTTFVASNLVRGEHRRQVREQEAAQMNAISESPDNLWLQLEPVLDETIEELDPPDRQAIVLRFFERRDFRSVGNALGISDDAAQKRVSRAIEKLRALLVNRGVTLSVILLSGFLAGKVVAAAPSGLAANVARAALSGAGAGGGLALVSAQFLRSLVPKIALAGIVVAAGWTAYFHSHFASRVESAKRAGSVAGPAGITNTSSNASQSPTMAAISHPSDTNGTGNVLLLEIEAADSDQPVPDVRLDYWIWHNGHPKHEKPLQATRFGVCKVPVPEGTTELSLVSGRDGFADTLLDWHPDRGEQIPAQYTLRLARAVPLGGRVVGPDGNPVAGAQVGFNNQPDPALQTRPQSDDFGWPFWITAASDSQGHWEIDRIGKEALKTIYGSASDPDFVASALLRPGGDPEVESQMLAATYVFKLGRAVTARGMVKDPSGQPVANAGVLVGSLASSGSRNGKTGTDGTFSIAGCQPGTNCITARLAGYAPATVTANLTDTSGPVELVLRPGKLFKLRVTDGTGNPIAHAAVWLNTFYRDPMKQRSSQAQVYFSKSTDSEGRLEWSNAPDGQLVFDITAAGYMNSGDVPLPADGTEHVVVLQPALTISGTVSDANTGKLIPKFCIVAGWPQQNPIDHRTDVSWSTLDRFWLSFAGGNFQHTYEEPVVEDGRKDHEFIFKFEAEGYAPYVTRVVHASERSVEFEISLTPAQPTAVTVLSPDGDPAVGADIGLISAGSSLSLVPGGFSHDNPQSAGTLLESDRQGEFALPPDPSVLKVVAACPEGYAEATPSELASNPIIQLQPWGQIEGIYQTNGQPAAGCTLAIQYQNENFQMIACSSLFQTRCDSDGRFAFLQVPPTDCEVSLVTHFRDFGGRDVWTTSALQSVNVVPGTNAFLTIDSTNVYFPSRLPGKIGLGQN